MKSVQVSVLKQTLSHSEYGIILIDDCSTGNSDSVIKPFIFVKNKKNNEK